MNKTIFNIPEGCSKVSIEQVGNKIVTEFEMESISLDKLIKGQIYHSTDNNNLSMIFIYKSKGSHFGLIGTDGELWEDDDQMGLFNSIIRPATPSEKQLLFDALSKDGKSWNAETLQIEDLKIKPKVGDCVKATYDDCSYFFGVYKGCGGVHRLESDQTLGFGSFVSYKQIEVFTPTQFQSEVNALGFEYDFKNDIFKELKWVPKKGEKFWYIYLTFIPYQCTNDDESIDKELIRVGNCFKTKSECESTIEKIKLILKTK